MSKFSTLVLLAALGAMSASAQTKFDASGQFIMSQYDAALENPGMTRPGFKMLGLDQTTVSRGETKTSVFIALNEGASASDLEARGFEVITDLGDIVLVSGSLSDIKAVAECDFVKSIAFGEQRYPMMNLVREQTGADQIHSGVSFADNRAFTGNGVICGIFDTGIDIQHVNFRSRSDINTNRIKRAWYYMGEDGTISRAFTTPAEIADATIDEGTSDHGTHTLGIMSGAWNGAGRAVALLTGSNSSTLSTGNNPYYGMAPDADIALCTGAFSDQNIISGVGQIVEYAKSAGKPVVVNLSIGSNVGPHDGTDIVSQAFDRLSKDAIICISAGNEGNKQVSIDYTFSAGNLSVQTIPYFFTGGNIVDVYSNDATPFDVVIGVYDTATGAYTMEMTVVGGVEQTIGVSGAAYTDAMFKHYDGFNKAFSRESYVLATTSKNTSTSNRYSVRLNSNIAFNSNTNSGGTQLYFLRVVGKAGQRVMITTQGEGLVNDNQKSEKDLVKYPGFTGGDNKFSINSMACSPNVICVGAWTITPDVPLVGNMGFGSSVASYQVAADAIGPYSSYGRLADGRELPLICAPGTAVVSSVSSRSCSATTLNQVSKNDQISAAQTANGRLNIWKSAVGTSMASPVVAGGIALWLEADPSLTSAKAIEIVRNTAIRDKAVTDCSDPIRWGAGKFDALTGLKMVITGSGISDVKADNDNIIITSEGADWTAFDPTADRMHLDIYSTSGAHVASQTVDGNEATISTAALQKGIYILSVNGSKSQRIVVNN